MLTTTTTKVSVLFGFLVSSYCIFVFAQNRIRIAKTNLIEIFLVVEITFAQLLSEQLTRTAVSVANRVFRAGWREQRVQYTLFGRLFSIADPDTDALLRRVDLIDRADDRVSEFSKGMKQRLMIARALINTPDVLFLDEPTDGLDPVSSQSIRQVIQEEAHRGAAVLLTTHDMAEADKLSDRVAFIHEGHVLVIDTPENLKLTYGRRSVKIRARRDGEVVETVVPLDESDSDERVRQAVAEKDLLTIHTEEATLEDIFIHFAGRGLDE